MSSYTELSRHFKGGGKAYVYLDQGGMFGAPKFTLKLAKPDLPPDEDDVCDYRGYPYGVWSSMLEVVNQMSVLCFFDLKFPVKDTEHTDIPFKSLLPKGP